MIEQVRELPAEIKKQVVILDAEIAKWESARQSLIDQACTPEVMAKMADIEVEFSGKSDAADKNINALKDEIKEAVKGHGKSVKASFLHAVFTKGQDKWNGSALEGYAAGGHPEIIKFKKTSDPPVSFRNNQ